MPRGRQSVGIVDIAQAAGVSAMTVSRAMRGVDGVSEAKRAEIMRLARRMEYVPNSNARSLAVANSDLIGISLPTFAGEVFAEILAGMRRTLTGAGYASVIDTTEYRPEAELAWIERLLSWRPAGVILTGTHHLPQTVARLRAARVPVLEIWDHTDTPIDICVGIDHRAAGRLVGDHAASLGYTRAGVVLTPEGLDRRADGRLAGLGDAFGRVAVARPDAGSAFAIGAEGTRALMRADRPPDVLFYLNDHMAFGGMMACQALGLDVPGDLGVVGFNALDLCDVLPVPLTTVVTPRRRIGVEGARALLARINGLAPAPAAALPVEIREGGTLRRQ